MMIKCVLIFVLVVATNANAKRRDHGTRGGGGLAGLSMVTKQGIEQWWKSESPSYRNIENLVKDTDLLMSERERLYGEFFKISRKLEHLTKIGYSYKDAEGNNFFVDDLSFQKSYLSLVNLGLMIVPEILTAEGKVAKDEFGLSVKYYTIPEEGILLVSKKALKSTKQHEVKIDEFVIDHSALEQALLAHELARYRSIIDGKYEMSNIMALHFSKSFAEFNLEKNNNLCMLHGEKLVPSYLRKISSASALKIYTSNQLLKRLQHENRFYEKLLEGSGRSFLLNCSDYIEKTKSLQRNYILDLDTYSIAKNGRPIDIDLIIENKICEDFSHPVVRCSLEMRDFLSKRAFKLAVELEVEFDKTISKNSAKGNRGEDGELSPNELIDKAYRLYTQGKMYADDFSAPVHLGSIVEKWKSLKYSTN